MTTIAYRDGVLAADSLVTLGDTKVHGRYLKIQRIGEYLVGVAGGVADCQAFVDWAKSPEDDPPPKGSYSALVIDGKGRLKEVEGGNPLPKLRGAKFAAIGSGGPFAIAAMYAGASAVDAVKIACKIDTGSGLPVKTLKVS